MRKKAPPRPEFQNEWFVATLRPAAQSLFSDSFYPEPTKRTGEMKVFVSVSSTVKENPETISVRIMNGLNVKTLRMMSAKIAQKCLDLKRSVTKPEFESIRDAILAAH